MMEENGLPKGWVERTLGEVVHLCNNKIPTAETNLSNYISTENLLPDKKGVSSSNSLPNVLNVNHYKVNDTLFSNIRTYFKKVWHADKEGGASNDVLIFRPKNSRILYHKFLFYHISSDIFIDFTVKTARGTKMPRGDKNAIITSKILMPHDVHEQKAIASILTSLDDKIELLQAQNETLETIAQTIFKEWFGKYQVGDELPEGWRVGKLGKEFDIIMGQSPKGTSYNTEKKGTIFFQGRAEFTERFPQIRLYTTEPKRMANKFDVLVSVRAPVGDINVALDKCCIGRGLAAVSSLYKSYCLYKLKSLKPVFDLFESEGTVFGSINKASFSNIEVVTPTDEFKEELNSLLFNLDLKIYNNYLQIQTLQQTRDTLLPKLMSGQLRVAEFKEQLSEVM